MTRFVKSMRYVSPVIAAAMLLAATACGGGASATPTPTPSTQNPAVTATPDQSSSNSGDGVYVDTGDTSVGVGSDTSKMPAVAKDMDSAMRGAFHDALGMPVELQGWTAQQGNFSLLYGVSGTPKDAGASIEAAVKAVGANVTTTMSIGGFPTVAYDHLIVDGQGYSGTISFADGQLSFVAGINS